MLDFFIVLIAFFITAPILITFLTYYSLKFIYHNPIKAFHKAINWTTIVYILAVNTMLSYLFGRSYIGYIIVLMLFILTAIIVLQWKNNTEINFHKAFKLLWRISFLFFLILYIILVLVGIIRGIIL